MTKSTRKFVILYYFGIEDCTVFVAVVQKHIDF